MKGPDHSAGQDVDVDRFIRPTKLRRPVARSAQGTYEVHKATTKPLSGWPGILRVCGWTSCWRVGQIYSQAASAEKRT